MGLINRKAIYQMVREEVTEAAARQGKIAPFALTGRGYEPRLTLDRRLATILRNCALPRAMWILTEVRLQAG